MTGFHFNIFVNVLVIINLVSHRINGVIDGQLKNITCDLSNKFNTMHTSVKLSSLSNSKQLEYIKDNIFDVNHVPDVIVRTYKGAMAKLSCKLNDSILLNNSVMWLYQKNSSFMPFEDDETIVTDYNLTIYNVRAEHAGVYRCVMDDRLGGIVILEVVDDEHYTIVKPPTSKGPYPMQPVPLSSSLVMLSIWSDWSECSRCGAVGRRRRYGLCYVSPINQVSCKEEIVNIKSESGGTIESVNNTGGIYSLHQKTPSQPPLPARSIIYVEPGQRAIIICYGTILRDIPYTWRIDTHEVSPKYLWSASGDRIHLNARDHIVISHVLYSDARVYSCWQDRILCGVVKLQVHRSTKTTTRLRLKLLMFIVILAVILSLTLRLIQYRLRYLGIQV